MENIFQFVILVASLAGFILSFYIFKKKRSKEAMVCPIGSDCDTVVHSDFSRFLGIPVEILGIIYYGVIGAGYAINSVAPSVISPNSLFTLLIFSIGAVFFSAYLTTIQGFVLKEWCTWCLTSAFLSLLIFVASLSASTFEFMGVLAAHGGLLFLLHLGAIALGIGASTTGDLFFLKFLRDFKISVDEANSLRTFGQIVWFALGLVLLTALGLFLPNVDSALGSPQFVTEMFALLIIILNATFLTLKISPKLVAMSFDKERFETPAQDRQKKRAFGMGAVSLASWYFVLILASPISIPLDTPKLILAYTGVIFITIGISQLVHDIIESRAKKHGY